MMMLRGGVLRRLCSLPLRPFSVAADASSVSSSGEREGASSSSLEVSDHFTRHVSLRDAQKTRTQARVESQLRSFLQLRSGEEAWSRGAPKEAYWLLRACGSDLVLETIATRMDLVHKMWVEFQKKAPLPVGMYNTLLQVYQENGHKFNAVEFLEDMEQAGVMPNQGTLVAVLCCYCEAGDIEGATRVLDQMRALDLEITENVYAALITGHCRRGDMESAEGMLVMMKDNGMVPTATSYTALLCGHAERGDMDRVEELLETMRERRVFPSVSVFTAVMDRLSAGGHSDLLPRALDLVHNKQLIYNDLYELACKCTVRRDNKAMLTILHCLATLLPRTTNLQLGAILVRTMAAQDRSLSEIMVMVDELQRLGFSHHVHEELLHSLHTRQDAQAMADALTVLQDMHRYGAVVKEHYFYPILAYHAEQRNVAEALRCVEVMKGLGLRLRKISFQYLLKAVREEGGASSEGGVASSDDISRLLEHIEGTPLSLSLANEMSVYLLDRGKFERVPELLSSAEPGSLVLGQLLKAIKSGVNRSNPVDVDGLVKVYTALSAIPDPPNLSVSVAITTAILVQRSPEEAKQFIEELGRNDIDPGEKAYHTLLHSYGTPDRAKEFHSMVKTLQSRGLELRPSIHKLALELAAATGDPVRAGQAVSAIRRSGQHLSATAYSRYIIANTKARRIGTALELYDKMRSFDLRPSYEAVSRLMEELLQWGDLHGAESMRKDLEEMGYTMGLVLRNSFLGAYARRDMTKALQEFAAIKASEVTPTAFTYNEIMMGYSLHGDTESIRQLFNELQSEGLSLDRGLVSRLFDAYITKGDLEGALAMISEHPTIPPHISSLVPAMQLAVDRRSEEEMGRVEEEMRKICGDKVTDNVKFFAHLKDRQTEKAQQLLEGEGFSLNPGNLISYVVDRKKASKREDAYAALQMLKDKGHHLGDENAVIWLRSFDILADVAAAVELRTELLAAGHTPSAEFSSRLATMMERHGHSTTADSVIQ